MSRLMAIEFDPKDVEDFLLELRSQPTYPIVIPIAWTEFTNRVYSCLPYTQEDYLCADENS